MFELDRDLKGFAVSLLVLCAAGCVHAPPTDAPGKPVQYPPGPSISTAVSPAQITTRQVEANIASRQLQYDQPLITTEMNAEPPPLPGAPKKRGRGVYFPHDKTANAKDIASPKATDGSFLSIDFDDNGAVTGGFRFIPPDSHAAVGPDHVIVVANVSIRIHEKDGTVVLNDSLQNFFAALSPATFTFDPKVIYDQYSDRWIVITLEQTDVAAGDPADTSFLFLALSDTSDPLGSWTVLSINTVQNVGGTPTWADYPGLGLDEEGIYITTNQFNFGIGNTFANRLWAIEKGEGSGGFYDGGPANVLVFDPALMFPMTLQSSHMFGTPPGAANVFLTGYSGLSGGGTSFVQVFRVDSIFGAVNPNLQYVAIGVIENNPVSGATFTDAPQMGSANLIETNDRRTLNTVWRDDLLWTTMTVGESAGSNETSAHWNRIDTSNLGTLAVDAFGNIDGEDVAANSWTFFPSVAVNSLGDAILGISTSAASIFPSAHFAALSGEGPATFGGSQLLEAGVDSYFRAFGGPRNRWGDYSGAAVDPANECFWVYNEYAQTQGTNINGELGRWGTAVLKYCPCTETINLPSNEWLLYTPSCNVGDDNSVRDVFGEVLDPLDYGVAESWVVYGRNASTQAYEVIGIDDPLTEGSGYWIKTLDGAQTLRVDGIANVGLDIPLTSDPNGRLNMVGHPHEYDVCWEDATVLDGAMTYTLDTADPDISGQRACAMVPPHASCVMSRVMQQWNGSAYQAFDGTTPGAQGTLEPMRGMWVEAFQSGLVLRVPRAAGSGCTSRSVDGSGNDWHLTVHAESGGLSDYGILGQMADALDGADAHDLPEFAPFGNQWLTVVFTHPDWGNQAGDYQSDFRALGSGFPEWNFEVRTTRVGENVTLSWDGPADEISGALLQHVESGFVLAPNTGGTYQFVSGGTDRFRWLSGVGAEWIFASGFEGL